MWESPIKTICDEMRTQVEGEVIKAVQRAGIDVDKDELIKALNYDRGQYEKGLLEGYAKAKSEIIRCKGCKHYHEEECPMRFVEWATWEEDGYVESDDVVHDYATDDGFCHKAERWEDE